MKSASDVPESETPGDPGKTPHSASSTTGASSRKMLGQANAQGLKRLAKKNQTQRLAESSRNLLVTCPTSDRIELTPTGLYAEADTPKRHQRHVGTDGEDGWPAACRRVLDQIGSGCLIALIGARGTGKTQIANQAILAACAFGYAALYTRAMTVFLEMRATFSDEAKTELDVVQRYRAPRLLVIDEMQDRGDTPWEDRLLSHLIDLRYGDMTDTILVANLNRSALVKSLGESISDRLRETGGIIECAWDSFRVEE